MTISEKEKWLERAKDEGHAAIGVTCCGKEMTGSENRDVCSNCGAVVSKEELLSAHGLQGVRLFNWVSKLAPGRRD